MCRLLAYLGAPIQPNTLIYDPEHSLELQSYCPKETVTTSVNADGVGLGWYGLSKRTEPFVYKSVLPIWADRNLPHLGSYVDTQCFIAHIRSATPGQASNLSNCQPFSDKQLLFAHNGFIENFRDTLYLPIRRYLTDEVYRKVEGTTDSEHIFALIINELIINELIVKEIIDNGSALRQALVVCLETLEQLAAQENVTFSANIVLSDGHRLVASRFARGVTAPSLYVRSQTTRQQVSTLIASEPLFPGEWHPLAAGTLLEANLSEGVSGGV